MLIDLGYERARHSWLSPGRVSMANVHGATCVSRCDGRAEESGGLNWDVQRVESG